MVNLRIGTVASNELKELLQKERTKKTLLSHEDLFAITKAAIETEVLFGTYYAVSDHEKKPWSTENTKQDWGYRPDLNTKE